MTSRPGNKLNLAHYHKISPLSVSISESMDQRYALIEDIDKERRYLANSHLSKFDFDLIIFSNIST